MFYGNSHSQIQEWAMGSAGRGMARLVGLFEAGRASAGGPIWAQWPAAGLRPGWAVVMNAADVPFARAHACGRAHDGGRGGGYNRRGGSGSGRIWACGAGPMARALRALAIGEPSA